MSQHSNEAIAEMDNNYKQTFMHDAGARVLDDLKLSLRFGETLFHSKITEAELAFLSGRQSVINEILFRINKE